MHTSIEKAKYEKIEKLVDIFNLFNIANNNIHTNFKAEFEKNKSYISVPFTRNHIGSRMMKFMHSYFDSLKHYLMYYSVLPIKNKKGLNFENFLSRAKHNEQISDALFSQIFRNTFPFSMKERFFDKELREYKIFVDDDITHNFECAAALALISIAIHIVYKGKNEHDEPSIIPSKGNNLFRLSFRNDYTRKVFMEKLENSVCTEKYDFNFDIKPYLSFETHRGSYHICVNAIDDLKAISKIHAGLVHAMFNVRVKDVNEDTPSEPGKVIRLLCEMIGYIIGQDVKYYHAHRAAYDNDVMKQLFVPLKNGANKLTLEEIDVINKYFGINIIKLYETDRCNFYDQGKKIHRPEFMKRLFSAIDLTDPSIMQALYKELVKNCEISAARNSLEMKPMLNHMGVWQQEQSSSILHTPRTTQHREEGQSADCTIS